MKTLLTFIFLCFISTFTFANYKPIVLNNNLTSFNKIDLPKFNGNTIEIKEVTYDFKETTCVATFTINIIDSETGRKVFKRCF